jgi:translation elongation factor EF-Tu-like GTPase
MDLADPELVELVEMDVRELLAKNGFDETLQSSRVLLLKLSKVTSKSKTQSWNLLSYG